MALFYILRIKKIFNEVKHYFFNFKQKEIIIPVNIIEAQRNKILTTIKGF